MEKRFERFTVLIAKISRNIKRIKNQEMAEYELNSPQISCLYYLYSSNGLTATELCEKCEEDKATVSRAIEYLEARGFVFCETKSSKRYKSPVTLTDAGREVGKIIFDKVNRVLDEVSVGLTEDERVAFYKSLAIISDNLDKIAIN